MIKIATFVFNPFGENTYLLYDQTKECIIVDAGCFSSVEEQRLKSFIEKNELKPIMALNTHAHIDHICGVHFVKIEWKIPFAMHSADLPTMQDMPSYATAMGFDSLSIPEMDIDLSQTTEIKLGESTVQIIHTPGHSPGGVCIYTPESGFMITGDTLFKESIGRTDLPGGSYSELMESIIKRIAPLGEHSQVDIFPGHGPKSSISHELLYNPFVTEAIQGQIKYDK